MRFLVKIWEQENIVFDKEKVNLTDFGTLVLGEENYGKKFVQNIIHYFNREDRKFGIRLIRKI